MRFRPLESLIYWTCRWLARGRPADLSALDADTVERVLLISSTALGDTVLSSAAFAPLRRRFPRARIVALIHRDYLPLFAADPALDAVVPFHGGYRRFLRTLLALRREAPQLAVILHGNEPQATPLAFLAGARTIVKLPNTSAYAFLLANRQPVLGWPQLGHGLQQRLRTAALVGASVEGARMRLVATPAAVAEADAFVAARAADARPLIGFQCGASSRSRMWPAESFVALGRELLARHPRAAIVLPGAPGEAAELGRIAAAIGPRAVVAAGVLSLVALPELLRRMALLVSGDTGTMHVAFAVGTPVVGLFAVSDPAASGPAYEHERHRIIHRPCDDASVRTKSDDPRWIARIGVAEVAAAVESLLAGDAGAATPAAPQGRRSQACEPRSGEPQSPPPSGRGMAGRAAR